MKKINIYGYNLLDLILLGTGIVCITTISIIFKSPWYVLTSTLLGLLCVFTQAKGKVSTQFIGVVYLLFYSYISYTEKLYGEVIFYLVIMIPMYLYGIVHWLKHRSDENNVVLVRSNLSKKEWLFMSLSVAALSVGIYFMLKALNTAQVLLSTLSFVSMLPAVYLLARRCKWNEVAFLANDIITPILWTVMMVNGNMILLPMVIYHFFQITYDTYGIIIWLKLEKHQKQPHKN